MNRVVVDVDIDNEIPDGPSEGEDRGSITKFQALIARISSRAELDEKVSTSERVVQIRPPATQRPAARIHADSLF